MSEANQTWRSEESLFVQEIGRSVVVVSGRQSTLPMELTASP